jgi:hypothetical protein
MAATLVGSLVMSWIVVVSLLSARTPGDTLASQPGRDGRHRYDGGRAGRRDRLRDLARDPARRFQVWDGWVIAAIVLWTIAAVALWRSFVEYAKPVEKARALVAAGETAPSAELTASNRALPASCSASSRRPRSC